MPSRNRNKIFISDSYYHVYNRGVEKRTIFLDESDYAVFLNLLKRYLSRKESKDARGRQYQNYHGQLELLAYCLMPNHYHLLFYVHEEESVPKVLQAVNGSYVHYFNEKYDRVGPLFQDRYKASHILNEAYLMHISRYIHLNPRDWRHWQYSSLPYYLGTYTADWVLPERAKELVSADYLSFLEDYEDYKATLEKIRAEIVN